MKMLLILLLLSPLAIAQEWQTPRTPWGDPDLQGIWNTATITTLERLGGMDDLVISEPDARWLEQRDAGFSAEIDNLPEGDLPAGDTVGGYNTAWLNRGNRLLRINGEPRTSIIVDPENGKVPYTLTGWARYWWTLIKSQKRNNPEEQLLGDRCVVGFGSTGGPPMLPVLYNNNYQFVQTPGQVAILVEMNHAVRTIRMGGDPLPKQIRPWLGDSIGHWEVDTLVVETSQFHPQQSFRGAIKHQLYVGLNSKVTERFTRTSEHEIFYEFTVEDDEIYRHPWRGELIFGASNGPIYEYACHEGNYGMIGVLAGERAQGVDGIRWLYNLITNMPEEVTHKQLSSGRFDN
ncbi:MAG: hypothetical protein HOC23_17290 [Halieaceae bacterium]|jgi:hypothetical protein|nr:hypothetical protein [Halieaceae bacterium]